MTRSDLTVRFIGPALDAGTMNVRDLAPALLAVAEMFHEVNRTVRPGAPDVSLEIKANREGSFEVVLDIVAQIGDLFSGENVTALANMKALLFDPIAGGIAYLIHRRRKGDPVAEERLSGGIVRLTYPDGTSIEYPIEVLTAMQNINVLRAVEAFAKPLGREGIDAVEVVPDTSQADRRLIVTADDRPALVAPAAIEQPLMDVTVPAYLSIVNVAFQDGNKWRFSEGDATFYAAIADEDFNERVDDGEPFAKGDLLRCDIRVVQVRTAAGLQTERTVVKVHEHIQRSAPIDYQPTIFETMDDLGDVS